MREDILARMRADAHLPVLPEVLSRIDREFANPNANVRSVASIISMDPVLAGQVLHMANSAYYSRGGAALTNSGAAVMRLGMHTIRNLVYALSLPGIFKLNSRNAPFSHSDFWRHSLAVASFAKSLAVRLQLPVTSQDLVYFAGLMHDIGAMLFLSLLPEEYSAFLLKGIGELTPRPAKPEDFDLARREAATFGISHAELGSIYLAERWKMTGAMNRLVREHHLPDWENADGLTEVLVVHLADGICSSSGATWNQSAESQLPFLEPVWEHLGISLEDAEALMAEVQEGLSQAQELLSLQA